MAAVGGVVTGVTTGVATRPVAAAISTPARGKPNFRSERKAGSKSQTERVSSTKHLQFLCYLLIVIKTRLRTASFKYSVGT